MANFVKELSKLYDEVTPMDFYRTIFPKGELDTKNSFTKGKYTGIACEIIENKINGEIKVKRYSITDDLDTIRDLQLSDNFIVISPISYIGKSRKTEATRAMYAFAIELDGILVDSDTGRAKGLSDMLYQMKNDILPYPNYIVASGNGLHLYYVLDKPLLLFDNVKKSLMKYKKNFTMRLWNEFVTSLSENVQYESSFQGFRMVGGVTKKGDRTRVFKVKDTKISISELNKYVGDKNHIVTAYKSDLSLTAAKEKYPEWYEKIIVNKQLKSSWVVKRDLYDWWLKKIKGTEVKVGHRYYCLMCLCIYAIKCNISYEELERDCFSLLKPFDDMSVEKDNQFTKKDVIDALQAFEDKNFTTYPIDIISKRSGIPIKKNKRNGRKQYQHLERARAVQKIDYPNGEWREGNGRKSKENIVKEWRLNNPVGRKTDCIKDTGLSKKTVYKWW